MLRIFLWTGWLRFCRIRNALGLRSIGHLRETVISNNKVFGFGVPRESQTSKNDVRTRRLQHISQSVGTTREKNRPAVLVITVSHKKFRYHSRTSMDHEGYTDKRTIAHSTGGISNGLFSFLFFMYMAFRIIVVACFLLWMPFPPHPQATNTWHIRPSAILSYADQPSAALTANLSRQKKTPLSSPQLFDRSKNNRKFEWIRSTLNDVDQWQKWARCWKIGMWLRPVSCTSLTHVILTR